MSERRILFCNVFPQAPAAACTHFGITVWCMVLITVNRSFCTASVCDKYQVIFSKNDSFLLPFTLHSMAFATFFPSLNVEDNIGYFGIELEVYTGILQIFLHRKNQGFILIISVNFSALKSGSPEIWWINRWKYSFISSALCQFSNANMVLQYSQKVDSNTSSSNTSSMVLSYRSSSFVIKQLHDLHAAFLAQIEFSICMSILTTIFGCTAKE